MVKRPSDSMPRTRVGWVMRVRADATGLAGGTGSVAGEVEVGDESEEEEEGGRRACLETSWVSSLRVMEM